MPGVLWSKQILTVIAFVYILLMRKHPKTHFVSSAKSYLLPLNDEEGSAADGELDDRLKYRPSGLSHLLCHLKGRKLAGFILPSTIDSTSLFCTSATARNKLPNSLKFCSHCGLQQGTLGIQPEPSLSFMITVIFIWWEWERCYCLI